MRVVGSINIFLLTTQDFMKINGYERYVLLTGKVLFSMLIVYYCILEDTQILMNCTQQVMGFGLYFVKSSGLRRFASKLCVLAVLVFFLRIIHE